ncbi:hypothetical protein UG55_101415 [Frankia sp. EI5c]|uniref:pyrophosphorylase n=1 Tax=Frankia sp. EI5c TaxID=683316 RepID=UPI0007C20C15|nr:pyrophosphorylase [Frankia sp. EI5c]OAA26566.1 hypothetical protein UG55_101415 [Frankia sp. EI5c]
MRTVTTPAAQSAASQMSSQLVDLQSTTANLVARGNALADPANWEGPKAHLFRTQIWPEVQNTLSALQANLADLARSVTEINQRTALAGS